MKLESAKQLQGKEPIWCAGCGDFAVLRSMQNAIVEEGLAPEDVVVVTGIGCSGTLTSSMRTYGFHALHGRALPAATGIKLAAPEATVLVAGGDGDGYGIGLGHFMHAARRNVDVCYVVMDNQVYGLTKGQTSPTTDAGMSTKASPLGPMADPVNPLELAMAAGASFIAQGFSGQAKQLTALIRAGMQHKGFALINVQSPCVTYNHLNTYDWFRERVREVDHDPGNRAEALAVAHARDHVPVGIIHQVTRPVLGGESAVPASTEQIAAWSRQFSVR